MIITEDMLYELLTTLNNKLKKYYIQEAVNKSYFTEIMQVKKISVYSHSDKRKITAESKNIIK